MFVDRDSGAQEDAVPESTRRTLRYDARDCGHAADVPADGYVPIPQTRALEPESAPADATQPAVRLGGDWIQTMDASSGDLYYCNLKTGESSWEPPAKVPPPTPQETASLLRATASSRVDSSATGVSAAPPRVGVSEFRARPFSSSVPRDALPSATRPWERFSKKKRASSSFAAESVDSAFERYAVVTAAANRTKAVASSAEDGRIPETARLAWRAARCKETGRRYWHESATGRTSWTLPESSDEDAPPPPPVEAFHGGAFFSNDDETGVSGKSLADAHLVLRPSAPPPSPARFARSRNAPGSDAAGKKEKISPTREAVSRGKHAHKKKPDWDSKSPTDATREAMARARGAALRAARAEAPRVSSPTATTLSPLRAGGGGTAAPAPATLAKMEVLKRRSSSARERRLAYGEQVRARTFAELETAVATEPAAKALTGLSLTVSLASPSPSPSPSPRASERRPVSAHRASSRRSTSLRGQPSEAEKPDAKEKHNPFAAVSAEEAAAVTLQARVRGFLARKRAREIKAWAATKSGAEKLRADERARAELKAASSAKLRAERSRTSVPPGLIGSFNDRAGRRSLDKTKAKSEKRDADSLFKRNALPPEPSAAAAGSALDEASARVAASPQPTRAAVAVQDAQLSFEAYAATHFATSAATDPEAKKPTVGCFGFCRSSKAREPAAEDASVSTSHASSPIRGALTAAAEALGASSVAAALFRALLDHAGDGERRSLTRARGGVTKGTAPSWLFFRNPRGTAPREPSEASDWAFGVFSFARDDAAGAAMRDEWYCQVVKQTSNHPSAERELRVWRLAYLTACAFTPSAALAPHVLARCRDAAAAAETASNPSLSRAEAKRGKRRDDDGRDDAAARVAVVAEMTRVRLVAALAQGASFGSLGDETRARAADRDFLGSGAPEIPAFGATLEELAILEARARVAKARDAKTESDPAFASPTTPDTAAPSPSSPVSRALAALLRNLERNSAARGLFRGAPDDARAASALARAATRAEDVEAAARDATPGVAAELVKLVLRGLALPVIPANMHAACLASEASPQGVTRALAPLPDTHRAALAATVRAAAAAAAADAFGAPASGEAARAAEAIAAELAPCLMFPAAASGEDRDERGRAVFVTRLIRVMLARAPTES